MSKKWVCLYKRDYMFNCNENENDNRKIGHTNKNYIDLDVDMEVNIQIIACLSKTMPLRNKQHSSNIRGSVHYKVKQHRGWIEKRRSCL